VAATQVDHIEPHGGSWHLFVFGAVQSLCAACHQAKSDEQRRGYRPGFDETGMPTDPRHPVYRVGRPER
jgi:hypothetical protein